MMNTAKTSDKNDIVRRASLVLRVICNLVETPGNAFFTPGCEL